MKGARENRTADGWLSLGTFLLVLGVYLLSSPGRIDIVDGQIRFDVTQSWISTGLPELRDPALRGYGLVGRDGKLFGFYNAGPSVAGAALIWLGRTGADEVGEMQRFLFSLTSSFFGAGIIVVLYFWLRRLGCNGSRSLAYSLIAAFATYLWPLSATTFDQAQQAFLLTAALYLGWQAGVRDSLAFSAWAGVACGCLLNYQEYFILLWPAVLLVTLRGEQLATSRPRLRVLVQLVPILIGVALLFAFNELRFGAAYFFNRQPPGIAHPSALGNPLVGLPGLLLSPGKSILLYSPVLVLGVLGLRRLRDRDPWLVKALWLATGTQLVFISWLSFFGSDWAWGPRYLGPLIALWVLPAALWSTSTRAQHLVRVAIVVAGVTVQLLALSIDNHRFFFEHRLPGFFWKSDPWFYFRHSALLERPGEISRAWQEWRAGEATEFAPVPYRGLVTYMTVGNADRERAPEWIRGFRSFHLARPWPLWMAGLDPGSRPVNLRRAIGSCLILVGVGASFLFIGRRWLRRADDPGSWTAFQGGDGA